MDHIVYNGTLCTPDTAGLAPGALSETLHLYQRIHTRAHRPLHLAAHLEVLGAAAGAAFGGRIALPEAKIGEDIRRVLRENRYPAGGNCVTLRVWPGGIDGKKEFDYMVEASEQLYYAEYTVWHKRLTLAVMPCEYLLMGLPTSAARQAALFSRSVARREKADIAVIENMDGTLTQVEDEPLFLAFGKQVATSPLAEGVSDTVLRRLILLACAAEKIEIVETPLRREMLAQCDEAFTATVQGLLSLEGYRQYRYFSLIANRLAPKLNAIIL